MKIKIFLLLCLIVGLTASDVQVKDDVAIKPLEEKCPKEANMNAYIDFVMLQMGPWINQVGWIPMVLPDIEEQFEAKPIIITYKCLLQLWDGVLDRFDGCVRQGESIMYYDRKLLRTEIGWALRNIRYKYDYRVVGMDWEFLSQDGWLEGGTDKFIMYCDFMIDMTDFYIYLQDFRVEKIGSVWHELHGNWLTDWLTGAVLNTMTFLFRGVLRDYISDQFRTLIQEGIDKINNRRWEYFDNVEDVQVFLQNFDFGGLLRQ